MATGSTILRREKGASRGSSTIPYARLLLQLYAHSLHLSSLLQLFPAPARMEKQLAPEQAPHCKPTHCKQKPKQ